MSDFTDHGKSHVTRIHRLVFAELQVRMDEEITGMDVHALIDGAASQWCIDEVGGDDFNYMVGRLTTLLIGDPYEMLDIPDGTV